MCKECDSGKSEALHKCSSVLCFSGTRCSRPMCLKHRSKFMSGYSLKQQDVRMKMIGTAEIKRAIKMLTDVACHSRSKSGSSLL